MPMTAMPQRIALSHAFGALAAALVGHRRVLPAADTRSTRLTMAVLGFEVAARVPDLHRQLMAFGKLQG